MKFVLGILLLVIVFVTAFAQDNPIEVKTDRYSETTTIKMKSQKILDTKDQIITLRLEAIFEKPKATDAVSQTMDILSEHAMVWFDSSANVVTDFGDEELHFFVDGKRLNIGESSSGASHEASIPGFKIGETFANSLKTDQLKLLAKAKQVEMRLGSYEFKLDSSTLAAIRSFTTEFLKHAPSSKLETPGRRRS